MEFSKQECWSGMPFPFPGDLPDPGIEPRFPALQADYLPSVQFSSVAQSCPTLCNPMNRSMPDLPSGRSAGFFATTLDFSLQPCSVQFISVAQSCPTLCNPMNRSTPGLPVHHQLLEFTQTHVHRVGDAIQPSHPLSSPSPPALNPSKHQGLFQ